MPVHLSAREFVYRPETATKVRQPEPFLSPPGRHGDTRGLVVTLMAKRNFHAGEEHLICMQELDTGPFERDLCLRVDDNDVGKTLGAAIALGAVTDPASRVAGCGQSEGLWNGIGRDLSRSGEHGGDSRQFHVNGLHYRRQPVPSSSPVAALVPDLQFPTRRWPMWVHGAECRIAHDSLQRGTMGRCPVGPDHAGKVRRKAFRPWLQRPEGLGPVE
jgi:hypothetical protein